MRRVGVAGIPRGQGSWALQAFRANAYERGGKFFGGVGALGVGFQLFGRHLSAALDAKDGVDHILRIGREVGERGDASDVPCAWWERDRGGPVGAKDHVGLPVVGRAAVRVVTQAAELPRRVHRLAIDQLEHEPGRRLHATSVASQLRTFKAWMMKSSVTWPSIKG